MGCGPSAACAAVALMACRGPSAGHWRGSPPDRAAALRRRGRRRLRPRSRRCRSRRCSRARPRCIRGTARVRGGGRARARWTAGRNSGNAPRRRWERSSPHTAPAPCVWRIASCRRPCAARAMCAPFPGPSTGRSGTSRRRWAGRSARKGRRPCEHRSAGGRGRAWPRGMARRLCARRPADGGRTMCIALHRAAPPAAACPRRDRRAGTVPGRGRRRAGRSAWLARAGPARRHGACRRIPGTSSDRARADICRNGSTRPARFVLRAAGADLRAHARHCGPWGPRRRGFGRRMEAGRRRLRSRPPPAAAQLSSATCRAARSRPRWNRRAACPRRC